MSAQQFKDLGNQAFTAQKYQEAVEFYSKAIELAPNDHILYSNRSGSWASLKDYNKALEDSEKCIQLNPGFAKGYQRKGLAQHYLQDYVSAIETYKNGLEIDPNNQLIREGLKAAEDQIKSQFGQQQNNPFAEAFKNPNIAKLLGILQRDPRTAPFASDPTFMQLIGLMISNPQMASQFMQTDPRIQTALTVILENPEAQQIFFSEFAGKVKTPQQQQQQNQKMEEEVPHQDHQHEHDHNEHEHHDHQHQQHQEPPRHEPPRYEPPKQPRRQSPPPQPAKQVEEWEVQKNLGNEAYKHKEFQKALEFYDKALQLNAQEPLLYNNKAAVFIELKQYAQGLESLEDGLKLLEEHKDFQKKGKLLARKAKIFWLQDDLQSAIDTYERSLLEDNIPSTKEDLRKVQKIKKERDEQSYINPEIAEQNNAQGGEFFKSGKFPDAVREYSEAIKRNPQEPKYYTNRATAYMKLMEFQTAVYDCEKALNLDPKNLKAIIKKANCHSVMKEYHKAQKEYEKGLALDPNNDELKQGLEKTKIQILSGSGSEEEQKQRASRAMQDPEIQQILREPEIINLLNDMQQNPQNGMKALKENKDMAAKVEKLIAAGVLRMG
ncbi:hypothetical protein pb186bvf_019729 [Paramecium bursaria]